MLLGIDQHVINQTGNNINQNQVEQKNKPDNKTLNNIKQNISEIVRNITVREQFSQLDISISNIIYEAKEKSDIDEIQNLLLKIPHPILTGHEAEMDGVIYPNIFFNHYWTSNKSNCFRYEINKVVYLTEFVKDNYTLTNVDSFDSTNSSSSHISDNSSSSNNTINYTSKYKQDNMESDIWVSRIFIRSYQDHCAATKIYVRFYDKSIEPIKIYYNGKIVECINNTATIDKSFLEIFVDSDETLYVYFKSTDIPSRQIPCIIHVEYTFLSAEVRYAIADNYDKLKSWAPNLLQKHNDKFRELGYFAGKLIREYNNVNNNVDINLV